jgi:hypothetical protein
MEYLCCSNCDKKFLNKWKLERHLNGKRQCKRNIQTDNTNICCYCNNKYSTKYYLEKHKNNCKQKTNQNNLLQSQSIQSNNNIQETPSNINHIHDLPITLDNTSNSNVNVNAGNTTNITNNNSNNTTNINVPNFIYPFGFEDMSYISDDEKLRVLTCKNPILEAIKVIYSKPQNCNIYRPNSNKDNVKILGLSLVNHKKNFEDERYIEQEFPIDDDDDETIDSSDEIIVEESMHHIPRQDLSDYENDIEDNSQAENRRVRIVRKEKTGLDKYDVNLIPDDYNITVENIKYSDISKKITTNAQDFLLRLLHACKYKLTCEDQMCIIENIDENKNKVSNDFYLKYIVNFLETHFTDINHKNIFTPLDI